MDGSDRRTAPRARVILSGTISFNNNRSRVECIVRDLAPLGVRLELMGPTLVPDHFQVNLSGGGILIVKLAWRRGNTIGASVLEARLKGPGMTPEWAAELRKAQVQSREMRNIIDHATTA